MIVLSIYKPWILDLHSLHIHADQLGGEFWQLINPFRPSKLDDDVLALDIAEVVQARPHCLGTGMPERGRDPTPFASTLMSLVGQNPNPSPAVARQLSPAPDMPLHMLWPASC